MGYKWTDEELTEAVKNSRSIRQVLKHLGLAEAGGNYQHIPKKIRELGLDTSHFTGRSWSKGRKLPRRRQPLESYFIVTESQNIQSSRMRERLISEGYKEARCESCGLDKWLEGMIPLELDHTNGNRYDNRLENLRILCPNCHALTDTYRGKNIGRSGGTRQTREV